MRKTLITFLKKMIPIIVALIFVVSVAGCKKSEEGTMKEDGKKIDETVEATKNAVKDAGQTVKKDAKEAKDAVVDAAKKAADDSKK